MERLSMRNNIGSWMPILGSITFLLMSVSSCAPKQTPDRNEVEEVMIDDSTPSRDFSSYLLKLESVVLSLREGHTIPDSQLVEIIPTTFKEYVRFAGYEVSFRDTSIKYPDVLRLEPNVSARFGKNTDLSIAYLEMSEFVDGEQAESYLDNMTYFAKKMKEVFCSFLSRANPQKVERLEMLYDWDTGEEFSPCK